MSTHKDSETLPRHGGPAPMLDVRIQFTRLLPVVRISGGLDVGSAHLLEDAFASVVTTGCPASMIVLDLGGVTFCDISGLRAVEAVGALLAGRGKELILHAVPAQVEQLIGGTGIGSRLNRR